MFSNGSSPSNGKTEGIRVTPVQGNQHKKMQVQRKLPEQRSTNSRPSNIKIVLEILQQAQFNLLSDKDDEEKSYVKLSDFMRIQNY